MRPSRSHIRLGGLAIVAGAFTLAGSACGRNPFAIDWEASPDTALVYSLARPELNLPTAYDLVFVNPVMIQAAGATGTWDFALDNRGNGLALLPPGVFGIASTAQITSLGRGLRFEDVARAPTDTTLYVSDEPMMMELGNVYALRTHRRAGAGPFSENCFFYAKLQPLVIDVENGVLTFVFDRNPFCSDPDLVPKKN
ncbi:MAG: hypothetical protein BMS9Abin29_0967 [Gemmatimonadota bacterium]|nr:MAG: hypothetical protein BMS9Abin29_0967 [Gemmatimonadota bacterium]